jgi:hypothetical protein
MNKLAIILLAIGLNRSACCAQPNPDLEMKKIEIGGMAISWYFEDDALIVDAQAPDEGWVGIGFNLVDEIVLTNLVMAGVDKDGPYLSERFVRGFGDHRPVAELGGTPLAKLLFAEEKNGATRIRFSMPTKAADKYHYDLSPGVSLYLICAYSMEDDLAHHSRMRRHVRVVL